MFLIHADNIYIKTLEDLCLNLVFHKKDKRKYHFLLKNIPCDWLDKPGFLNFNIYDRVIESLNLAGKSQKYQNILTPFSWINVMLRKLKISGDIVLRITNLAG